MSLLDLLPQAAFQNGIVAGDGANGMDKYFPPMPAHKGLFGIHGTFRDILGILGDTLGGTDIYRKTREQEKLADAYAGFNTDPSAAIERIAKINPVLAQKLYKDYTESQLTAEEKRSTTAWNNNRAEGLVHDRLGAMAATATPENWPLVREAMRDYAIGKKVTPLANIPDTFDPTFSDFYRQSAISAKDDRNLDIAEDRAADYGRNVDSQIAGRKVTALTAASRAYAGAAAAYRGSDKNEFDQTHSSKNRVGVGTGKGTTPAKTPTAPYVRQNGVLYKRQPDGTYKEAN